MSNALMSDPIQLFRPPQDGSSSREPLTKTEAAYRTLRAAIESGQLAPRERLLIQALQSRFAMSATPIREALRMLQSDGLVDHVPHRGMVVAEFTAESTEEIYRLRAVLEPVATELAVARASDETLEEIKAAHEQLAGIDESHLALSGPSMNAAWHRAIYRAAGSRYLEEFISRLWAALPVEALWVTSRARESLAQHEAIMVAFKARNSGLAAELMRQHIVTHGARVAAHLRQLSDSG
jgi:DNA-binding GntR family transcriptional regulator